MGQMKLGKGSTPGPWVANGNIVKANDCYGPWIADTDLMLHYAPHKQHVSHIEQKANADLIAKAPLLVECADVLSTVANCQSINSVRGLVLTLLAKLEESNG